MTRSYRMGNMNRAHRVQVTIPNSTTVAMDRIPACEAKFRLA